VTRSLPESLRPPRAGGAPTCPPALILTAHGSVDPRSPAVTHAVAEQIRLQRPGLEVLPAFCEKTSPKLREVLRRCTDAVVSPLLLASAYHANVDIPAMLTEAPGVIRQADTLGEDPALLSVSRQRLAEIGVSPDDDRLGVLVVAVGSSSDAANARTSTVARALRAGTRWAGAEVAFATGPHAGIAQAAAHLRSRGAQRLVIAPWFLAHGKITDRVANFAAAQGISMAEPLGSHSLVAATVLDRFDAVASQERAAA
jgi:sirohydrochlorin ferrochelatase